MRKIYFVFAVAFVALSAGFLVWQFSSAPKPPANENEQELIGDRLPARQGQEVVEQTNGATTDNDIKTNNMIKNENGLIIETLAQGAGQEAKNGDTIAVHYVGTLQDGAKFDSSLDRGQAFVFTLGAGQVIKGWDMGVLGMKVGEKRKLTIPSELAYGVKGAPGAIPPNAILIFEVELLAIQ